MVALFLLLFPVCPCQVMFASKVQKSFALRKKSEQMIKYAKRAVEMAIEQSEDVAMDWLKNKLSDVEV